MTLLLLMLLFGWMFVVGRVASAEFVRRFAPSQSPTRRRWIVTVLSHGVSLALCWLINGSKVLDRMFYMP